MPPYGPADRRQGNSGCGGHLTGVKNLGPVYRPAVAGGEPRGGMDSSQSRLFRLFLGASGGILFFLFVACHAGIIDRTLQTEGITVDARVVGVDRRQKGTFVTVEFLTRDGVAVTVKCSSCGPELVEGDTVAIRYDPSSPSRDVEAVGNRGNRREALFALAMVAVLSVVAAIAAGKLMMG